MRKMIHADPLRKIVRPGDPIAYQMTDSPEPPPPEVLGDELVPDPTFLNDPSWSHNATWVVGGGTAVHLASSSNSGMGTTPGVMPEIGKTYKLQIEILSRESANGSCRITMGGVSTPTWSTIGVHSAYITAANINYLSLLGQYGITLNLCSVKEVLSP